MLTPWVTSFSASALVCVGSSWSLMNLISSGRPLTPPAALIFAISIFAASSAGASNGAMFLVRSMAAPITIGLPVAAAVRAAFVVATTVSVTIAATANAIAASLRCLMLALLLFLG